MKTNSFRFALLLGEPNGNDWQRFTPQTNLHTVANCEWSANKNMRIEMAMSRLIICQVTSQKHLCRFILVEYKSYQCGEDGESVEHHLMQCN